MNGNKHECNEVGVVINEQDFFEMHQDHCEVCNEPGEVLCCATCSLVFHIHCVSPKLLEEPPNDWTCAYCVAADDMGVKKDEKEQRKSVHACREMERMKTNIAPPLSAFERLRERNGKTANSKSPPELEYHDEDEDNDDRYDVEDHENDEDCEDYECRDGTTNVSAASSDNNFDESYEGGVPCAAPSDVDDEDEDEDDRDGDEDHEDDEDYEDYADEDDEDEDNDDRYDDEDHKNDEDCEDYEGRDGTTNVSAAAPSDNEVDESSEGGVPCAAPSDEDDKDEDEDIVRDGDDTTINNSFNDTDINGDDPVAAELGPNDIKLGVHHSQMIYHPGTMRAKELALLHYQEYCGTNLRTLKRMLVARLIKRLENEGRKFLLKTSDGWRTMSDKEKLIRYSKMISTLNRRQIDGRVKVKPKETVVKLNKSTWNDDDCKTLREYISESDVDDELKWGRIAKKLNRTTLACKSKMRMILDCGIFGEEKTGEHI
jgi:hypothetical protein